MRKILCFCAATLAAACGGPAQQDAFQRATPAFSAVALEITSSDANSANFENEAEPDDDTDDSADTAGGDACHPHLFLRTHDVVHLTNRGLGRIFGPIHRLVPFGPRHTTDGTHVWQRVMNGVDYQYSVVKSGNSFTATLQVKKEGDPDTSFVTVYSATTTRDPANDDGSGSATLDLDKLASVTGDAVSGQLALTFNTTAAEKKVIFTMTNFKPKSAATPRDGHYVYDKQTGVGGSLKFIDDMTLRCTGATPPASGTTPVTAVSRWIVASDGTVHFRGDAGATGGQIPTGDKWEGVTCAQGKDPRETYWLMKLEDSTGATISAHSAQNTQATAAACDPVFAPPTTTTPGSGPVPLIDSKANDYDFTAVNFTSDDPLPFP
ncbi:MAG TPA: hypothetical protein VG496_01120 [Myxococcales bacterium]|nr:hypothetical protein [Myxococcales bacterium]